MSIDGVGVSVLSTLVSQTHTPRWFTSIAALNSSREQSTVDVAAEIMPAELTQ